MRRESLLLTLSLLSFHAPVAAQEALPAPTAAAESTTQPLQLVSARFVELVPGSCHLPHYPRPHQKSGESGEVEVQFTFYWDAAIRSFHMTRRTDHPLLDQLAAEAMLSCRFRRLPPLKTDSPPEATLRVSWPAGGGTLPTQEPRGLDVPCDKPRYPPAALRLEARGTTRVRFEVNRQGTVVGVTVEQPSGTPALDDMAIRAVGRCSFRPWSSPNPAVQTAFSLVDYQWRLD